jgi:hypothetical protein
MSATMKIRGITRVVATVRDGMSERRYYRDDDGDWVVCGWRIWLDGEPGRWHRVNDPSSKSARRMFHMEIVTTKGSRLARRLEDQR